jgi:hypothetical protein
MQENKLVAERRSHPRIAKSLSLKLGSGTADCVTQTKNISVSGALCEVDRSIDLFTKLKITLLVPLKGNIHAENKVSKISCEGVVVRKEAIPHTNKFNIAIFFNRISKVAADKIYQYVSSHTG